MAVGLSAANVINKWLDSIRGTSAAVTTTAFVQLHTADPGAAGATGTSAGSTARPAITWGAPTASSIALSNVPTWTNGGTSETITHISVWTAASAGSFLYSTALTTARPWASGDQLTLNSQTFTITPTAA